MTFVARMTLTIIATIQVPKQPITIHNGVENISISTPYKPKPKRSQHTITIATPTSVTFASLFAWLMRSR